MNEDLFDILNGGVGGFGGFGGFGGRGGSFFNHVVEDRRRRKGQNTVQPLNVSLEDLYKGKTSKLQLTKKCLCSACNGRGGKAGASHGCDRCRSSGKIVETQIINAKLAQQISKRCPVCNGEGKIINEKDKCRVCNGLKTVQEQKIIEVTITPGMKENEKIVFPGEGDQEPDVEPGDVILVIKTKPHDLFKRKNHDLFIQKKISINEALCGFTTNIKHLDGRNIVVSTKPGEVIPPESIRGILDEGMPKPSSYGKGNLYIIFDVEFPPNYFTDDQTFKKIESLLPPKPVVELPSNVEEYTEVNLNEYDPRRYERCSGERADVYHEDDDSDGEFPHHEGTSQHVQCAQQ